MDIPSNVAQFHPVQAAARAYIARGLQVVLLEPKSKKCVDSDWLTRTYKAEDFKADHNIGLKSVGGLVDVDCDCVEAAAMAEVFLPRTPMVFGRDSRPSSHLLYRCPEITKPLVYKDLITGKTLLEIRVNHQTMAPPSNHPGGERVAWADANFLASGVEPLDVEHKLLVRSAQLAATGSMIALYYNPPGARHEWGLALAGLLRQLTLNQHEAELALTKAAKWAKDEKVKDRLDAIRTTYSRSEDEGLAAGKKLIEQMGAHGEQFIATLHKIWGGDVHGISKTKLDQMNDIHAVVFQQSGKVVIITEEQDDNGRPELRYSNQQDFHLIYPTPVQVGVTSKGTPIMKPLASAWLQHPKRRFYRGIELAPKGSRPGYYNLWRGFTVEPRKGDWDLFKRHILMLVQNNADHAEYVFTWMAETVQHPERPIGKVLAFKGEQGTGKSTFACWFGELFGPHFLHLDSENRLLGNFNAHLHNKIVLLADEAVWAGGKAGLGALKRMVTERTLNIERKGVDVMEVRNMLHIIVASNMDWVIPADWDNRRFAVFEVSEEKRNDIKFFGAVHEELFKKGGLSALLYDLLNFKVNSERLQVIPETKALIEQKIHSAKPAELWWLEKLRAGVLPGALEGPLDVWPSTVDKDLVHADYIEFLKKHWSGGYSARATQTQLGMFISKHTPLRSDETTHQGKRRHVWQVPQLHECRKEWVKKKRLPSTYEGWDKVDEQGALRGDDDIPF